MDRRNWLDLSRKLVDRFDLDYTVNAIAAYLGKQALAFFGEGVIETAANPAPFPISLSGSVLGGTVGDGEAFDPNGQITQIPDELSTSKAFTVTPSDPSESRWDLLVIRYLSAGSILVPKPSDPIDNIYLDLVDSYVLAVISGTVGANAYPAKGANDIILAGLQVPAAATLGTQIFVDLTVREIANTFKQSYPDFVSETPAGIVNGTNKIFTLSKIPLNPASVFAFVDGAPVTSGLSISGQTMTFATAPATGQDVYVQYVTNLLSSPLAGAQEVPIGTIDGTNRTFTLSGQPADQRSSRLYVNGEIIPIAKWQLVLGNPSEVILNVGYQPLVGQDIYMEYFVNPATVGIGTGGGGGITGAQNIGTGTGVFSAVMGTLLQFKTLVADSGITITQIGDALHFAATGSGVATAGTGAAPETMDPSTGLVPLAAQNQTQWLRPAPGSGVVPVTAASQILSSGVAVGWKMTIKGTSDTDAYEFNDGDGLSLNGSCTLFKNQTLVLSFDGSVWSEDTRRF